MNLPAIEKMNKDRDIADKIVDIVEDWLIDEVDIQIQEFGTVDPDDITVERWADLQGRIERLLGE